MRPLTACRRPLVGRCACATLVAATVAIGAAQQASQPPATAQNPPSRPTFRTGTDAVVVDLRVLDRDGKFVGDLTKDDFRIFEDDKEQAVVMEGAKLATDIARAMSPVRDAEGMAELQKRGMTITRPDMTEARKAAAGFQQEMATKLKAEHLLKQIQAQQ